MNNQPPQRPNNPGAESGPSNNGNRLPDPGDEDNPPIEPTAPTSPSSSSQQPQHHRAVPEAFDPVSSSSNLAPELDNSAIPLQQRDNRDFEIRLVDPGINPAVEVADPGGSDHLPVPTPPEPPTASVAASASFVPAEPLFESGGEEPLVTSTTAGGSSTSQQRSDWVATPQLGVGQPPVDTTSNIRSESTGDSLTKTSNLPSTSTSAAHPSDPTKFIVDPNLLEQVLDFGFEHYIATLAIQRTCGEGVEAAVK